MTDNSLSVSDRHREDWMNTKWRPMMGWMYMATCITDFVVFPILWSLLQAFLETPISQWQPLTLQGAGLFHVAMGAVLGLAAWGRTQEKLNGANNGGLQPVSYTVPTTFGYTQSGGFQQTSYYSPSQYSPGFQQYPVAMSSTGKPMPILDDPREI